MQRRPLSLALLLLLSACASPAHKVTTYAPVAVTTSHPSVTALPTPGGSGSQPADVPAGGAELVGLVKAPAGLIGHDGASVVSAGAGNYGVLALDERPLVGAKVTVVDGNGQLVAGPDGQPMGTTTGNDGSYRLVTGPLSHALIVQVSLGQAGSLQALAPASASGHLQLDANVASTLATGYILAQAKDAPSNATALDQVDPDIAGDMLAATVAALADATLDVQALTADAAADAIASLRDQAPDLDAELEAVHELLVVGNRSASVTDGPAASAQFNRLVAVVAAPDGTVLLADSLDNLVRTLSPAGQVGTLAGSGLSGRSDRVGTKASFAQPQGLARAADGTVYVADARSGAIRRIATSGKVSTVLVGGKQGFRQPQAIAVLSSGKLVVAAADGISTLTPDGKKTLLTAEVQGAYGLALDAQDNLYAADTARDRVCRITPDGTVTSLGSTFSAPHGVAVGKDGTVYVADTGNDVIKSVSPSGTVATLAGSGNVSRDGKGDQAGFVQPWGLCFNAAGHLLVTERTRLRELTLDGVVTTLAGTGDASLLDGSGDTARFANPQGVVGDGGDGLLVADTNNHVLRHVGSDGSVTTVAGDGHGNERDGQGTAASFSLPRALWRDPDGTVYVGTQRGVRKVTATGAVTTLAGGGPVGYGDGQGANAAFNAIWALVRDAAGNFYAADAANNVIRKITPAGLATTYAGSTTAGYKDGALGDAAFSRPQGLAIAPDGRLYVADAGNHRVRLITPDGNVTTLAGTGAAGHTDGPAASATFGNLSGLALDPAGNLYIADGANAQLRKLDTTGAVTTPKPKTDIGSTAGLWLAPNGQLVVADAASSQVLRLTF